MREISATHPQRMPYVTELVGRPGHWGAKKAYYRAILVIEGDEIAVTEIGHRKEIYQ